MMISVINLIKFNSMICILKIDNLVMRYRLRNVDAEEIRSDLYDHSI
jgi:hypothetical protein